MTTQPNLTDDDLREILEAESQKPANGIAAFYIADQAALAAMREALRREAASKWVPIEPTEEMRK